MYAIIYLVFIGGFTFSNFDLTSVVLIVVFILVFFLPVLFSRKRYEFYENSLRIHKFIGGDSEIDYSDLSIYDRPSGRRPQIVLIAAARRRPIVISGNPNNPSLGKDLKQFLATKLKSFNPQSSTQQSGDSSPNGSAIDTEVDDNDFSFKDEKGTSS